MCARELSTPCFGAVLSRVNGAYRTFFTRCGEGVNRATAMKTSRLHDRARNPLQRFHDLTIQRFHDLTLQRFNDLTI